MRHTIHKLLGSIWKLPALSRVGSARTILVSDGAGWILDRVARDIVRHLPDDLVATVTPVVPLSVRDRVFHFVNRYAALEGDTAARLGRKNRMVLSWFHGGRMRNPGPEMEAVIARLREAAHHFSAFHVSSSLYRDVLRSFGIDEGRIVYIPIGVDTELFAPSRAGPAVRAELGLPAGAFVVGSFQRDGYRDPKHVKGPDVLIEALALVSKRIPRLHVLLAGPGRDYVRHQLQGRGVPFTYRGRVRRVEDLVAYYHACDVYLIGSREEGGPVGLLESMASGVPVVSTRVGMAVDVITSGWDGWLVEVEDAAGLAEGLVSLATDAKMRDGVGQRARATAQQYDWRIVAPEYGRRLYRALGS